MTPATRLLEALRALLTHDGAPDACDECKDPESMCQQYGECACLLEPTCHTTRIRWHEEREAALLAEIRGVRALYPAAHAMGERVRVEYSDEFHKMGGPDCLDFVGTVLGVLFDEGKVTYRVDAGAGLYVSGKKWVDSAFVHPASEPLDRRRKGADLGEKVVILRGTVDAEGRTTSVESVTPGAVPEESPGTSTFTGSDGSTMTVDARGITFDPAPVAATQPLSIGPIEPFDYDALTDEEKAMLRKTPILDWWNAAKARAAAASSADPSIGLAQLGAGVVAGYAKAAGLDPSFVKAETPPTGEVNLAEPWAPIRAEDMRFESAPFFIDNTPCIPILALNPDGDTVTFGRNAATVSLTTGKVTLTGTPDEAARAFWAAVEGMAPKKAADAPETYTSFRGMPLVYQATPTITTLTVENYCKWYDLFIIRPDGTIGIVPFGSLEAYCDDTERTAYVDHVPNPVLVERLCDAMGWELDEQAHEMMIGRWIMEGLDVTAGQVNAAVRSGA